MKSLRGSVLIASPYVDSAPFTRTVILLLEHSKGGALGLVLNRPSKETVQGLWAQIKGKPCPYEGQLQMGGPVSGPLMALHQIKSLSEMEVPPGVFVAATSANLERLVTQTDERVRMFVGHAGWSSGQLEKELELGVWFMCPAKQDWVFGDHDDLWTTAMRHYGKQVYRRTLGVKVFPADASLN